MTANAKRFEIDFNGKGNLRHARSETPYIILSKNLRHHIKPDPQPSENFSLFTLGLYTFIRMLPPDWEFTMRGLAQVLPHGRDRLTKEISILEEYGYLIRVQNKEKSGRFGNEFIWITIDDNAEYQDLCEYMKSIGYYVYEKAKQEHLNDQSQTTIGEQDFALPEQVGELNKKDDTAAPKHAISKECADETDSLKIRESGTTWEDEEKRIFANTDNVENNEAKPLVKTDALKTRASDASWGFNKNDGKSGSENVENSICPDETDSLKNRLSVFETENNNRIETTIEDNLTSNTAPAQAKRAEPKGSLRTTRCQAEESTSEYSQVGTGDNVSPTADTETTPPPEIAAIVAIVNSSPNRTGLDTREGKARVWRAYNELLAKGCDPCTLEKAWWDDVRLYASNMSASSDYPVVAEWLETANARIINAVDENSVNESYPPADDEGTEDGADAGGASETTSQSSEAA